MGSIYRPTYKDRHGKKRISSVWWIQYYHHGEKISESTKTADYEAAKTLLKLREGDEAKGKVMKPEHRRITFAELADDVMNDYRANGRASLRDLEARLRLHILPEFGKARPSAISGADIDRCYAAH